MKFSWLFVIALIVLVAIFSVQNAEPITVRFVTWQFAMSAALVIQLAAVLGALVGLVCGFRARRPRRHDEPVPSPAPAGLEKQPSPIERFD